MGFARSCLLVIMYLVEALEHSSPEFPSPSSQRDACIFFFLCCESLEVDSKSP